MNPTKTTIKPAIILFFALVLTAATTIAAPAKKMQLTLEADLGELILEMSNQPGDVLLNNALAATNVQRNKSALSYIDLFEKTYREQTKNANLSALFVKKNERGIAINSTNKVVTQYLKKESMLALKIIARIMEERLQEKGIVSPEVSVNSDKGIIKVSIEYIGDSVGIVQYLSATGAFGIYEVYNNEDMIQSLFAMNDSLAQLPEIRKRRLSLPANTTQEMALFIRENPLFSVLYPMMGDSNKVMTGPVSGSLMQSEKATLNQYLGLPTARKFLPTDAQVMYGHPATPLDTILLVYVVKIPESGLGTINNEHIVTAYKEQSQADANEYTAVIKMHAPGTAAWAAMTGKNVGRYIVFTLDDEVYSCPRVVGAITEGMTEISAHLSKQEAEDIANLLKYGKLPLAVHVIK